MIGSRRCCQSTERCCDILIHCRVVQSDFDAETMILASIIIEYIRNLLLVSNALTVKFSSQRLVEAP